MSTLSIFYLVEIEDHFGKEKCFGMIFNGNFVPIFILNINFKVFVTDWVCEWAGMVDLWGAWWLFRGKIDGFRFCDV